ncbi:hypothetical protein H0A36_26475 [Endozoicomonas sp. SM1973]|uniref:Uncharacterized protein n=1 Tax=Spartinivicinus marinus TaxID=2994442 RepID=A0A853IKG0_9GAMM|nr:hypothetical protein [Spartinivicinus marinus]MCX4030232.1 hypothetical protein [Spartinivicinus marinus]NYZ69565.1 hypothetical protein [Spartinivicinus marinus]
MDHWTQREQEYEKQWDEKFSNIPINFIDKKLFWDQFESEYRPAKRFFDNVQLIYINTTFEDIRSRVKTAPVFSPFEEDFPGPVERWYGVVKGNLFTLTYYYGIEKSMAIACESDSSVKELIEQTMKDLLSIDPYG